MWPPWFVMRTVGAPSRVRVKSSAPGLFPKGFLSMRVPASAFMATPKAMLRTRRDGEAVGVAFGLLRAWSLADAPDP